MEEIIDDQTFKQTLEYFCLQFSRECCLPLYNALNPEDQSRLNGLHYYMSQPRPFMENVNFPSQIFTPVDLVQGLYALYFGRTPTSTQLNELAKWFETKEPIHQTLAMSALSYQNPLLKMAPFPSEKSNNLYTLCLRIQLLILYSKIEYCLSTLQMMNKLNEDSPLSKIASAWYHLANGNPQETSALSQEIMIQMLHESELPQIYSPIVALAKIVGHLMQKQWEDAATLLDDASQKDPKDIDVLANQICCYQNLSQHQRAEECLNKLRHIDPLHPCVKAMDDLESAFQNFENHDAGVKI